jgi:hypothetical protein
MPRWVVRCPSCGVTFTYIQIVPAVIEESLRDPYGVLPKPTIPQGSEHRTCPSCRTESMFRPFHLFYRDDSSDSPAF